MSEVRTRRRAAHSKPADRQARKHRVLSQGIPSITRTIADAVVLKHRDLFLIFDPSGELPRGAHGLGLYYHDCRFLRTYQLRLNHSELIALGVTTAAGTRGSIQLTNQELQDDDHRVLPRETLGIEWDRALDGEALSLRDGLTIRNWGHQEVTLDLELHFEADFEDVFEVRGLLDERLGTRHAPSWQENALRFLYSGKDGITRSLTVVVPPELTARDSKTVAGRLRLGPREEQRLEVRLLVEETAGSQPAQAGPGAQPSGRTCCDDSWPTRGAFVSDSLVLDQVLDRCFADLRLLQCTLRGRTFIAAGIPWFATLFGRDSLVAALQLLPYVPDVARDTLRLLAALQADRTDDYRDAEPGKILHEYRVGEMARTGAIPHNPYYGTVDATPLFLLVLARYVAWSGDLGLFDELEANVGRALEWIDRWGDGDADGYVEYRSTSEHGLVNQGWKDSGTAIVDQEGRIATPPIALVEVQAYVYAAKLAMAALYARREQPATAERLRREAAALRDRFNRDFWVEEIGCYALALEARKRPLRVVSSNAGHALWSGIAEPEKAARVADRLMADDMFSGWGVRTLSQNCPGYNPIAYHLGTVWPHDNGFIAAGLRRYGFAGPARRIFDGTIAAATEFEHYRLPELWTGYSRAHYGEPIRYPVACHPQAWAAGSPPYQLEHLLGLEPDALSRRLRVVRPILPGLGTWLEVRGLRVADARVDLRFESGGSSDEAEVKVLEVRGELDVAVETQ